MNTISLTILAATVLLGAALLWSIVADRRRQAMQQRLKRLVVARDQEEPDPALTLRRRVSQARPGLQQLAVSALAWVQAELAATGNRIGVLHLVAVALLAGFSISCFLILFQLVNPTLTILLGLAAAPAA